LVEWISLVAAVAAGPAFLLVGYHVSGLVFRAAAGAGLIVFILVVPLLVALAGALRFIVWQVAIASMTVTVIADDLRLHAMHQSEIAPTTFVFWAAGTLLSSPLPIYLFLKGLRGRERYLACILIAVIATALWFGIEAVTR
jgi:hypothetical protein